MKTILFLTSALIYVVAIGAVYAGIGWCAAWLLEAGLNIEVNYLIFIIAALVIYVLKLIPAIIAVVTKTLAQMR